MGGIVHSVENAFHHVGHAVEQALPVIGAIAGVVLAPVTGGLSLAALAAYAGSAYAGYELGKGGQALAEGKGWGAARGDILSGAIGALGIYGSSVLGGAAQAAQAGGTAAEGATGTAATLGGTGAAAAGGATDATSAFLGGPSYLAGEAGSVGTAGSGLSASYLGSIASTPGDIAAAGGGEAGGGLASSYMSSPAPAQQPLTPAGPGTQIGAPPQMGTAPPTQTPLTPSGPATQLAATGASPVAPAAAPSMTDQLISGAKGLYQDYNQISGIIKPAMGVYNAYASNKQAGQLAQMSQQAALQANPLQPYQAQAAQQLAALQANPASITDSPEYKAMYDTQLKAAQRQLAARGMTDSGAAAAVAAQIAAQVQNTIYNQRVQQLQSLATSGAANAAQIGLGGQEAAMSLKNTGLNQLASSLGGYTLPGATPSAA